MLYEMGIPVVETGDKLHYEIGQKVPLTLDRENVLPAFLAQVRLAVFNRTHGMLNAEDVNSEWAESAVSSPECSASAVQSYLNKRFGEKRVSFDPSDTEANKIATSQGYTIVHGGMMSAGAWKNARSAGAISPVIRFRANLRDPLDLRDAPGSRDRDDPFCRKPSTAPARARVPSCPPHDDPLPPASASTPLR